MYRVSSRDFTGFTGAARVRSSTASAHATRQVGHRANDSVAPATLVPSSLRTRGSSRPEQIHKISWRGGIHFKLYAPCQRLCSTRRASTEFAQNARLQLKPSPPNPLRAGAEGVATRLHGFNCYVAGNRRSGQPGGSFTRHCNAPTLASTSAPALLGKAVRRKDRPSGLLGLLGL